MQIFDIEDDNFTFDKERAKKLMTLIIETFGEQSLELTAMNGVSLASLDGELLRLMKQAGFHTVNLSFVSTDPSTKKRMERPVVETNFDDILEETEKVSLNVIAYAIFGMPGQTIEEMVDTLIYLMGKRVLIGPSIYYPTPETDLFKKCKEMGILPSHSSQWRSSALPIETKEFNRLDIIALFRLARIINFIKGKMDQGELSEGMTWKELSQIMKDKAKGKVENESYMPCAMPYALCDKDDPITWAKLLLLLFREKSFFSLRRDSAGKVSIFKEGTSKKVLDYFFERAWETPILKSRND
jgi:radical SAM superfamily enzyme YgiQ (UPF0313 family)